MLNRHIEMEEHVSSSSSSSSSSSHFDITVELEMCLVISM